jgi:hypothetical protein
MMTAHAHEVVALALAVIGVTIFACGALMEYGYL